MSGSAWLVRSWRAAGGPRSTAGSLHNRRGPLRVTLGPAPEWNPGHDAALSLAGHLFAAACDRYGRMAGCGTDGRVLSSMVDRRPAGRLLPPRVAVRSAGAAR